MKNPRTYPISVGICDSGWILETKKEVGIWRRRIQIGVTGL